MSTNIPPTSDPSQAGPTGRPAVSSDELLPPIEPPSAGFFIQLFVVPAVIVAAVVLLWFVIESLARRGEQDPDQIVAALRSSNQARFQQAKELADMLRLPERYPKMKTNRELAQKLAAYLDELVTEGDDADAAVTMRMFIVPALGEFSVDDGLPALINAALNDPERDVRRKAINSIAVLAMGMANLKPPRPLASDELTDALVKLADDPDELIRSETAFALGVVAATPESDSRLTAALEGLADDPFIDARFNAAGALARLGSPRAAAAMAEMLDPEAIEASLSGEKAMNEQVTEQALAATKDFKKKVIINAALKAIDQLLANPSLPGATFVPLEEALEKFIASLPQLELPRKVETELARVAERVLTRVQARIGQQ
jgi:HEAT repeat protein